jgi:hypothetical protein
MFLKRKMIKLYYYLYKKNEAMVFCQFLTFSMLLFYKNPKNNPIMCESMIDLVYEIQSIQTIRIRKN